MANKYKEIYFNYCLKGFDESCQDCNLFLSEEECNQVIEVLKKNPEAKFADLPTDLYEAFQNAANNHALDLGLFPTLGKETGIYAVLEVSMPEDLKELLEGNIIYQEEAEPKTDLKVRVLSAPNRKMIEQVIKGKINRIEILIVPDNEEESIILDEPDESGERYPVEDEEGMCIPVKYDALKICLEKNPDEYIVVKVTDTYIESECDDKGYPVFLEEYGSDYLAENIYYELGEVLESTIQEKEKKIVEGPVMKCLALRQPWAQLVVCGIKDIECRDAMPALKKPKVFIAASGTKLKWEELEKWVQDIYTKYEKKGVLPAYKDLPTKCIVGHVDIVKASFDPVESIWGSDWPGMKYTLRNAEILDEPICGMNKATPYFYNVEGYDENHLPKSHKVELK